MTSAAVRQAMAKAIALASEQHPHPNPRVGAVILGPDDRELGAGAHVGPGLPHAERLAIADAGTIPAGATLVVTLEPCAHTGRTPPCTEAIIEAGIERVVVGALDPDPNVDGAGIERLRAHGIEVEVLHPGSDLGAAALDLDPGYFHHRRYGRPQVILKLAATLDGQVAAADGTSQWITGPGLRSRVHHWRAQCDAVMVGAGTVMADDPRLDVRLVEHSGRQPRPVIVVGSRPLPPTARIWERDPLVLSSVPIDIPAGELEVVGAEETGTRVDLGSALARLGSLGVVRLFVEGGPAIASSLMAGDLVDIGLLHLGARFGMGLGRPLFDGTFPTMRATQDVDVLAVELVDGDLEVRWEPRRS
jgi:diaminohydroxyphosphoribosylaminopyrimidine deaminase/5-amino-6-(5-phosphoribosylamino)uracil reductase